ncbi:MAG: Exopolysaccharide synthesis ExoD [Elusimicrobia bacterium]|nr:MAG: Exopolysaccharide synthesis ExoD [Elusimicrobiota bacterium]KAF0152984.1 MAG: Exopolysaccharide synthesis ExoD [Elusimicrobiota bacterium]
MLTDDLKKILALENSARGVTLGEVFGRIGDRGFGLLLLVLSLPSALPLPAPGYSTPFGILLFILALQMIYGRRTPWLPARAAGVRLKGRFVEGMIAFLEKFFGKVEFLIKPRLRWVGSRWGLVFLGLLVLIMAGLMILPIPLTNTAPAFVIFLIGVGLSEEDGFFCLLAAVLGVLATAVYALVVYLFYRFGVAGLDQITEWLREFARG